jgi:hypothetical protein
VNGPPELAPRYAPGEDVAPLVRALGGGLAGGLAALAADLVLPNPAPGGLVWPALWADAVVGDPDALGVGLAATLGVAMLAALVFAYGQFRRFVPWRAGLRGLVWGLAMGLPVGTLLLPRAVAWLPVEPVAAAAAAGLTVVDLALGLTLYGVVVGQLNRPTGR